MIRAERRITGLAVALAVGFALVWANLFRMQIVQGGFYQSLSEKNRIRVIYLEAARGRILDRRGQELATSRLSFNCSVIPREAEGYLKKSCDIVAPILGLEGEDLEKRYELRRKGGAFGSVVLAEDITKEQAAAIEERLDAIPGFLIETRPQREYPLGASAAHLVGYIGPLTSAENDLVESYGYRRADWLGREGVEQSYESTLRGASGGLQIEVDNRGRLIRVLGVKEPAEGKDVQLTVDARLQTLVQEKLAGQKGAVLVMDLSDGGLLCVNSSPSFDSNRFASPAGRKKVGGYLKAPGSPMMNRAIRGAYPPGSTFKIVTGSAALDKGSITPRTVVHCPGSLQIGNRKFPCAKLEGHGDQSFREALAHSCNVYFYRAGIAAGADALFEKARQFGFGERRGIDLPGEAKGFVPSKEWKRRLQRQGWFDGDTANIAIGQGGLQVTPLQALAMAAVAATGESIQPHVLNSVAGVPLSEKHSKRVPVDPATLASIREGMVEAVRSDSGTARLSRVEGLRIAAKTGTAQSGQGDKTHAWYVAYAPAEKPRVAMAVFVEHGGHGGVAGARIAQPVLVWLKENGYL